MSIHLQNQIDELRKRIEALEKPEATTQEMCDALQAKLDRERKTLTLPEKRKSA